MNTVNTFLDRSLFSVSGTTVTVATLLTTALVVLVTIAAAILIRRGTRRAFTKRGVEKAGTADAVGKLLQYVVVVIGFSIALQTIGVRLSALFAAGAVFAVGIGFAMQTIVQNFVSGVILMVERAITPGDIIEINNSVVRVEQMRIRSTIVKTTEGEDLLVPNSHLVQTTVKNYTLKDSAYRVRVKVGVVYRSDMRAVESELMAAAQSMHWRVADRDPQIYLSDFGNHAVVFETAVWTNDPWNWRTNASELRWVIWQRLEQAEIVIAFPQVDVHFDEPITSALTALRAV